MLKQGSSRFAVRSLKYLQSTEKAPLYLNLKVQPNAIRTLNLERASELSTYTLIAEGLVTICGEKLNGRGGGWGAGERKMGNKLWEPLEFQRQDRRCRIPY